MMAQTGLLVVTNLAKIAKTLTLTKKYVSRTLYIQLLTQFVGKLRPASRYCAHVSDIYAASVKACDRLDVVVIVSNLKDEALWHATPTTFKPVDVLLFDRVISSEESKEFQTRYQTENIVELFDDLDETETESTDVLTKYATGRKNENDAAEVNSVALGGTFDRLHVGHKLMFTEAVLRARRCVLVGVTDVNMIQRKLLCELILPVETRINDVRNFLISIDNTLTYDVIAIQDAFGPTKSDPNIDMLVVSTETLRGGVKVNEIRKTNQLNALQIHCIDLMEVETNEEGKEKKISSSNQRVELLGTLLKEPEPKPYLPISPYIIGLTGGIASGKTSISQHFKQLGAAAINCDKLAHEIYEPGTKCYEKLIEHFGTDILSSDNRINRKILGAIVFENKTKLNELNEIVWPELQTEIQRLIGKVRIEKTHDVVIIEAAVLLHANEQRNMHEVWSSIVPVELAIQRLINRDNLNEQQAKQRITSQPSNDVIVKESNVVFSTQWSHEFSRQQAEKAWNGLQKRLSVSKSCGQTNNNYQK